MDLKNIGLVINCICMIIGIILCLINVKNNLKWILIPVMIISVLISVLYIFILKN